MCQNTSEGIERTLENYSQLVKYYEDRREFGLAELFHVGEMDMVRWRRTSSRNRLAAWFERNVSAIGLYRLCSMYGSSYLRALTVLVALSIVFALSLLRITLMRDKNSNWFVIPAKAGIQPVVLFKTTTGLDPGLRRDDGICLNVK